MLLYGVCRFFALVGAIRESLEIYHHIAFTAGDSLIAPAEKIYID